ncbi:MFS transporter [Maridesulfovibrio hydrothermalis]|uniref:Major facilitator superfamily MFS_1 n=1 Tax=Maridesulfovibrio hydrothermalis AM13 = DSM 14728 TaxID=1121451 RepID=L0R830_9BACT|nr:MFS transporter [Maridesulfovibrio hydrothermalis]CCO22355.1 Major facilitator superfamily MFS_1 [Maridesulfovibrio hydrothermalis AM13 = DSM 14728]
MKSLYKDKNLHIVFSVTLMAIMGVSSIIPALPLMIKELGISATSIGLIFTIFTLPGIIFAPLAGIFADRLGRKKILVPSLILFALAGTACFFAPDYQWLLILRFIQGVGAAAIGVINLTIIGDLFAGKERIKAMGLNAGVLSMGTAIFPAIGGVLAQISWEAPFLLSLVALPLAWLVAFRLENPEPKSNGDFMKYMRTAFAGMKNKEVLSLFAISLLTFIILYGPIVTYLPILLNSRFAASPLIIGLVISSASFITAIAASQMGRLAHIMSQPMMIAISAVAYAVSMIMMPAAQSALWCILPVCIFGLGQGLNLPNSMSMLTAIAPMEQRAIFMSVNGMLLRVGQTIAPILMGLIYSGFELESVFYAAAGVAAVMFFVTVKFLKGFDAETVRQRL